MRLRWRGPGDGLKDVPVLDDLGVVVQTQDVDSGVVLVAWPCLVVAENDEVRIGEPSLELDALGGVPIDPSTARTPSPPRQWHGGGAATGSLTSWQCCVVTAPNRPRGGSI